MNHEKEYMKEEIRKEFQLERMVLFSDAVFAIAITLMAIEIKAPDAQGIVSQETFIRQFGPVLPVILAYVFSFGFVGMVWYQHLQLFSLLKDYNKGIVIRNLVMLFFIGLFPFAASVISRGYGGTILPMYIYMGVILCCTGAQHVSRYYILVRHPELCIRTDLSEHRRELAKSRAAFITFGIIIVLITTTILLIPNDSLKPMSALWFLMFPLLQKLFKKKEKKTKHGHK